MVQVSNVAEVYEASKYQLVIIWAKEAGAIGSQEMPREMRPLPFPSQKDQKEDQISQPVINLSCLFPPFRIKN